MADLIPPQWIIELFCDEQTASTSGRHEFMTWFKTLKPMIDDRLFVPKVGGTFSIFKQGEKQ